MNTVYHRGGTDEVTHMAPGLMLQWISLADGSAPRLEVTLGRESVSLRPQEVEQMYAYLKWSK